VELATGEPIDMPESELSERMRDLADKAVTLARNQYQTKLDFSEESLQLVERILAKLSRDIPKGFFGRLLKRGPTQKQIEAICELLGAYIGEVIRRKWDGTWRMDSSFGATLPALSVLGGDIYPTNKVWKRLVDGDGDNVWAYYRMLKHIHEHGEPKQQT
jgi:hypothetical protein